MATEVPATSAGRSGGAQEAQDAEEADPADLPVRILWAATRLFAEHGWTGTHVREVAEAAGCTPPALYYHFAGKEALWMAAVQEGFRRLTEIQIAARVEGGSVRERLKASVAATVEQATTEPYGLWLLYRAVRHPEDGQPPVGHAEHSEAARQRTADMLRGGMASGELHPELDVEVAVAMIHGVVDRRLGEYFYDRRPIEERWPDRAVEQLFRGLSA